MNKPRTWSDEKLYCEGDLYYKSLVDAIDSANVSIEMEMYIFHFDNIGQRITERLAAAKQRGVRVRIMVDGVGSYMWLSKFSAAFEEAGLDYKVYHRVPWSTFFARKKTSAGGFDFFRLLGLINRRNHRKVVIIDEERAWVGSINISDYHAREFAGDKAWRDTAVEVAGKEVDILLFAFNRAWDTAKSLRVKRLRKLLYSYDLTQSLVRLNMRYREKRTYYKDLIQRIRHAEKRILVTNAYFVPRKSLLKALRSAARRNVNVEIIVPSHSDVFFLPWVTIYYARRLISAGATVYEYMPRMLHAKTLIIDDWCVVGSTNLNHRSFLWDLEAEVVLTKAETKKALEDQFIVDRNESRQLTGEALRAKPIGQRIAGRILYFFRRVL